MTRVRNALFRLLKRTREPRYGAIDATQFDVTAEIKVGCEELAHEIDAIEGASAASFEQWRRKRPVAVRDRHQQKR